MKRLFVTLLIMLITLVKGFAQQEVLTNQSILDMLDMDLDELVIVTKISASECKFNTSVEDLKGLKEKGVGSEVIVAMLNANKEVVEEPESIMPGIYIDKEGERVRIYPTAFSGTKTNTLGSALSYGLADAKIKSTMLGENSVNVVSGNLPDFYFVFGRNENNIVASDWWFRVANAPNQFALVKLRVKPNRRDLATGKVNLYAGTSVGVDEDAVIRFKIEELSKREFKVTPEEALSPGEYCFIYVGVIPQGGYNNQAVFDFSVLDKKGKRKKAKRLPADDVYSPTSKIELK